MNQIKIDPNYNPYTTIRGNRAKANTMSAEFVAYAKKINQALTEYQSLKYPDDNELINIARKHQVELIDLLEAKG